MNLFKATLAGIGSFWATALPAVSVQRAVSFWSDGLTAFEEEHETLPERGVPPARTAHLPCGPSPEFPCVVNDCDYLPLSIKDLNQHCYWNHLEVDPTHPKSADPLVTFKRYPGADDWGDFKWFPVKVTASKSSTAPPAVDPSRPNAVAGTSEAGLIPIPTESPVSPPFRIDRKEGYQAFCGECGNAATGLLPTEHSVNRVLEEKGQRCNTPGCRVRGPR